MKLKGTESAPRGLQTQRQSRGPPISTKSNKYNSNRHISNKCMLSSTWWQKKTRRSTISKKHLLNSSCNKWNQIKKKAKGSQCTDKKCIKNSLNNNKRKLSLTSPTRDNRTVKRLIQINRVVNVNLMVKDQQLQNPLMSEKQAANWNSELNENKFRFEIIIALQSLNC